MSNALVELKPRPAATTQQTLWPTESEPEPVDADERPERPEWLLDEATKRCGRRGVKNARRMLTRSTR